MLILDKNVDDDQRIALRSHHLRVAKVGLDVAKKGMSDPDLIRFLKTLHQPTFATRDLRLYRQTFCHPRYCLAVFDVDKSGLAGIALRFLRHPDFSTRRKRVGRVVHAGQAGIRAWSFASQVEKFIPCSGPR